MKEKITLVAFTLLLVASLMATTGIRSARATTQEFHLYGFSSTGWGFSPTNMTSPGPTITVTVDDIVNLTLTNEDTGIYAPTHQFLLSYHNSSTQQTGDPLSPALDQGQTVIFTFTANVTGTFTYYCIYHPSPMYGTFIVTPVVPEFPSLVILSGFMIAVLIAVALRNTKFRSAPSGQMKNRY